MENSKLKKNVDALRESVSQITSLKEMYENKYLRIKDKLDNVNE